MRRRDDGWNVADITIGAVFEKLVVSRANDEQVGLVLQALPHNRNEPVTGV